MNHSTKNPFEADTDRHEVWEILMRRDFEAFVASDWTMTGRDFDENVFTGYSGGHDPSPDHWTIAFPTLESYKSEWLRRAENFKSVRLRGENKLGFFYRITSLGDIGIEGDRAVAHKKFSGRAATEDGPEFSVCYQTLYFLRKGGSGWKITGFVGYLPHPMAPPTPEPAGPALEEPANASQHSTAGPYSPVLKVRGSTTVAVSGQGPIDPDGNIVGTTLEEQTELTLQNCRRQLATAGASFADVYKVMVYMADINEWRRFNRIYESWFEKPFPVRTAVECRLWGNVRIEVDMLAALP